MRKITKKFFIVSALMLILSLCSFYIPYLERRLTMNGYLSDVFNFNVQILFQTGFKVSYGCLPGCRNRYGENNLKIELT